ncbi:hypothetical protein HHI36_012860 [Cryptolaemus montrouzieri]|uniref:Uncharacterized protein n=1 Tax=Cryptolaemus montrouzieri TaxID=559131 RepID=A0ABD2NFP5_9CUCU
MAEEEYKEIGVKKQDDKKENSPKKLFSENIFPHHENEIPSEDDGNSNPHSKICGIKELSPTVFEDCEIIFHQINRKLVEEIAVAITSSKTIGQLVDKEILSDYVEKN